jgi:hypothetical protein
MKKKANAEIAIQNPRRIFLYPTAQPAPESPPNDS